jgi:hypothetical protein
MAAVSYPRNLGHTSLLTKSDLTNRFAYALIYANALCLVCVWLMGMLTPVCWRDSEHRKGGQRILCRLSAYTVFLCSLLLMYALLSPYATRVQLVCNSYETRMQLVCSSCAARAILYTKAAVVTCACTLHAHTCVHRNNSEHVLMHITTTSILMRITATSGLVHLCISVTESQHGRLWISKLLATRMCSVAPLNTSEARRNPDADAALFKPRDAAVEQEQSSVEDAAESYVEGAAVKTRLDLGHPEITNANDSQFRSREADGCSSGQGSRDDEVWRDSHSEVDHSSSDSISATHDVGTVCLIE